MEILKVIYTNNSNTNLDSIIFHVWPNAYKNIDTELGKQKIEDGQLYIKYAPNYTRGYMDSLKFKVDGESIHGNWMTNILILPYYTSILL